MHKKIITVLFVFVLTVSFANAQNLPTAANSTVSTNEDVDKVFSSGDFNYSDADGDAFDSIRVTSLVSVGNLYFDDNLNGVVDAGENITLNQDIAVSDFNKLKFKPQANANGSPYDSFDFKVRDDNDGFSVSSYTMTIDVTPVNDPPVISTNTGITVDEGSSGNSIAQSNLEATDIEQSASQLTYTINTKPANGILRLSGTALNNGDTYTQQDINNGNLTYDHDGSETTSDSYSFTVDDGNGGSVSGVFNITINPVNDPPVLTTNTGITVDEGSVNNIILQSNLEATDVDNTPAELTYTVTVIPTNGTLKLSGTTLSAGSTFTQADINANDVTYTHDGSETTSDLFKFTVSDGAGGNIAETQFDITVTPVNDPPTITTNNTLNLDEGATATITNSYLVASDVDNTPAQLTFTISSATTNGTIYRNATALGNGDTFTQDDINNNLITYTHNGSETTTDNFTFSVSDGTASTASTTFNITINPVNDPPVLTTNTGITVNEGDQNQIISQSDLEATDADNTPAELTFTLTVAPSHGSLKVSGVTLAVGNTFTQADINSNYLTYSHDSSETTSDLFKFAVSDGAGGNIAETQFSITVNPVNDPPYFTTNPTLVADEGVVYTYNIAAADNDNTGNQLSFTATTIPSWLTLTDNGDGTAVLSGTPPHGVARNNPVSLNLTDGTDNQTQSFNIIVSLDIIVPGDYATIQAAIDASVNGDKVSVQPGTYNENIDFKGKNIEVYGVESDPSQVIIDGSGAGPVVSFISGEPSTTVLTGVTVQNGSGRLGMVSSGDYHAPSSAYYGGGIFIYASNPTLKNIIIKNNTLQFNNNHGGNGAGIYIGAGSDVKITGDVSTCLIDNNISKVYRAGGICVDDSHLTLDNVDITNNYAGNYGGGLAAYNSIIDMSNCKISGNKVDGKNGSGGGIFSLNSTINDNGGNTINSNSASVSGNNQYIYP